MTIRATSVARLLLSFLPMLLITVRLLAQQDVAPPADLPTETLHVYTNRMQFPTFLIDDFERPIRHINVTDIQITLDHGPAFHPSDMHMEGDDPLAIAVLLDLSGSEEKLLKDLPAAFTHLIPKSLHPQDHLYFYALDCRLIGLPSAIPSDQVAIRTGLTEIMAAPVHGEGSKSFCGDSLRLWDAVASISHDLDSAYGRHILLVVSPGFRDDSHISVAQAAQAVNNTSVAVFGIRSILFNRYGPNPPQEMDIPEGIRRAAFQPMFTFAREDPMLTLCSRSGGFMLNVLPGSLGERLRDFITLLRNRYILEFARPDKNWAGWHLMEVNTVGVKYSLPTGASAPLPNPALHAPNTVPSAPSPAVIGGGRVLEPKSP